MGYSILLVSEEGIVSEVNVDKFKLKFSTKSEWREINNLKSKIEEKEIFIFPLNTEIIEFDSKDSNFIWVKRSLKDRYDISDPKVGLLGEDNGKF